LAQLLLPLARSPKADRQGAPTPRQETEG
jgi:hypothetical protein